MSIPDYMLMINLDDHERRVDDVRCERDTWRSRALALAAVLLIVIVAALAVCGNALDSQVVERCVSGGVIND